MAPESGDVRVTPSSPFGAMFIDTIGAFVTALMRQRPMNPGPPDTRVAFESSSEVPPDALLRFESKRSVSPSKVSRYVAEILPFLRLVTSQALASTGVHDVVCPSGSGYS